MRKIVMLTLLCVVSCNIYASDVNDKKPIEQLNKDNKKLALYLKAHVDREAKPGSWRQGAIGGLILGVVVLNYFGGKVSQ